MDDFQGYLPEKLKQKEWQAIHTRRTPNIISVERPADIVGLALSGGGIRSAIFSLGLIQALAKHRLLSKVDYLSTVSGGGYTGSFWGRLHSREVHFPRDEEELEKSQEKVRASLASLDSKELKWLRENGRYISPNGAGDALLDVAVYIRNWMTLHFVLSLLIVAVFLGADLLRAAVSKIPFIAENYLENLLLGWTSISIWWSPYLIPSLFFLIVVALPLSWAYWLTQGRKKECSSYFPLGLTGLAILVKPAFVITGYLGWKIFPLSMSVFALAISAASALAIIFWVSAGGLSQKINSTRNALSRYLTTAFVVTAGLAFFGVVDSVGQTAYAFVQATWNQHAVGSSVGLLSLATLVAFGKRLTMTLASGTSQRKPNRAPLPKVLLAGVAALVLGISLLIFWSAISHAIFWMGEQPMGNPAGRMHSQSLTTARVSLDDAHRIIVGNLESTLPTTEKIKLPLHIFSAVIFGILSLLVVLLGRNLRFLNLSSQQQMYGARLARAYLGASNPYRVGQQISEVVEGDDIPWENYHPERSGGPLHLINVTVNETIDGKSQIEQRDRKGLGMCLSPHGMTVGLRSHAVWNETVEPDCIAITPTGGDDFNALSGKMPELGGKLSMETEHGRLVEKLSLGSWMAISGAAFSTGIGAQTNMSLSLLCGLANVRLGYWWDCHLKPEDRKNNVKIEGLNRIGFVISELLPCYTYFAYEFLARFPGVARRRWYLSDGGHFENTACYELLRRRVPFIMMCDDGADPDYLFEDLANLVRKARLDFQAEIRFLDEDELERYRPEELKGFIGTLQQLRRTKLTHPNQGQYAESEYSQVHATLALVTYQDEKVPASIILVIKPSLTGDEHMDVMQYHRDNPAFPQEPTSDQFFDEAQWESYRCLGEHIGNILFAEYSGSKWQPRDMKFLPMEQSP